MSPLGDTALSLAVLLAAAAILASLLAARFQSTRALAAARGAVAMVALMFSLAAAALLMALIKSDFALAYVAQFTERALPLGYKLAAFWAGQEGSLLLWALLLAIMSALAACTLNRGLSIRQSAAAIAVLAVVCAFFGLLILFAADPFALSPHIPADGNGLNPMLQDLGMIAHPPLLFLGYAGFTVPFALLLAAMITGQRDDQWIAAARRWTLAAWLFLTVGILLGAKWAYVELGWGGYWGWDPVENASLLPWLTATAFLHSIMVQQHRGMFRRSNAALLAVTFILCIFGTYLTRSGLVESVHGYGHSLVGNFFLALLLTTILFCAGLIVWRFRTLRSDHKLEGLLGREGAFLAANILLGAITLVVLIGTIFPAISGGLTGTRTTLGPAFFNKVFGPAALLLAALMATGPLQSYGKDAARRLLRGIILPIGIALLAAAILWHRGLHSPWAAACAVIAVFAVTVIAIDLAHAFSARLHLENPLLALPRLLFANHRRYGAQLAHLGVVMVLVGVIGSSVFNTVQTTQLNTGDSTDFAGNRLTLASIAQSRGPNYTLTEATLTAIDSAGHGATLRPQTRAYDKWKDQNGQDQPYSVVAIQSTWTRDLYVNLAGCDIDGQTVALQLISNPLVCWLWIGGWVVAVGGLICLLPRLSPVFVRKPRETPMKAMKPALASTVAAVACLLAIFAASLPSTAAAQTAPSLPPGHPDLSQFQPDDGGGALPPGHPALANGAGATTQPFAAGSLKIRAVQGTPGGPAIGAEPVSIELYCRGQLLDQSSTHLAPDGTLNVGGLPVRFGIQALVKITHAGIPFSAVSDAIDPEHPVQNLDVPIYEATTHAPAWSVAMRHVMVHPTATGIEVVEMLAINTPGDHAWTGDAAKTTFTLPLSPGATDLKVGGAFDPTTIQIADGKLVSRQPLVPGEARYQLQYTLPAHNGQSVLSVTAPAKMGHLLVFVPDDGTAITTTGGLQSMGVQQMDEKGTKVRYFMAASLEAGQTVTLTVAGKPVATSSSDSSSDSPSDLLAPTQTPQVPAEAAMTGSMVPKTVAAFGAVAMLVVGILVILMKKTPLQVQAKAKLANRGRGHGRR